MNMIEEIKYEKKRIINSDGGYGGDGGGGGKNRTFEHTIAHFGHKKNENR